MRKYPSDSCLNYSNTNSLSKKNELFTMGGLHNDNHEHHCNEGSVSIVSKEQFFKLLKSAGLK
jgi:hypothetical protein